MAIFSRYEPSLEEILIDKAIPPAPAAAAPIANAAALIVELLSVLTLVAPLVITKLSFDCPSKAAVEIESTALIANEPAPEAAPEAAIAIVFA